MKLEKQLKLKNVIELQCTLSYVSLRSNQKINRFNVWTVDTLKSKLFFMEVKEYKFEFLFGRRYTANCSEFMGWSKYPQIHVWVKMGQKEEVFNFYKTQDEIFWYELLPDDERLAYAIATVLGKKYNLFVANRPGIKMEL